VGAQQVLTGGAEKQLRRSHVGVKRRQSAEVVRTGPSRFAAVGGSLSSHGTLTSRTSKRGSVTRCWHNQTGRRLWLTVVLATLVIASGARHLSTGISLAADVLPRVFCIDPKALARNRDRVAAKDETVKLPLEKLLEEADKALEQKPLSVMDKASTPPSGDKHDYMSIAPYFWPDPTKKDGFPYIRKDGERNPESSGKNTDAPNFGRVTGAVETLGLAYYLTGKESYAEHAARLLRTWFLDPATRMNPHLNYGQAIRGLVDGRGIGIIETIRLVSVVDSVGLLGSSRAWKAEDQEGMVAWMKEYLQWLLTSKNGRDEQRATNNHGTYYDVQVVALALFTGQEAVARRVLEEAKEKRIAAQVRPDGSQPRELERTRSFSYSAYNLNAMTKLGTLGDRQGIDLWHYQSPGGGSIRKALDYLVPYIDESKTWPYKQITPLDRWALLPALQQAYLHYRDSTYRDWIARLPSNRTSTDRMWLTVPREP
jgi:hypothetical protein